MWSHAVTKTNRIISKTKEAHNLFNFNKPTDFFLHIFQFVDNVLCGNYMFAVTAAADYKLNVNFF